jgi:hypothetical protein
MLLKWRQNLHQILRSEDFQRVFLNEIRRHDKNPNSWVILDAFQKFFSRKNPNAEENFFHLSNGTCITISQEGIKWTAPENVPAHQLEDCEFSEWKVAQAVGEKMWSLTFLGPFPEDDLVDTDDEEETE